MSRLAIEGPQHPQFHEIVPQVVDVRALPAGHNYGEQPAIEGYEHEVPAIEAGTGHQPLAIEGPQPDDGFFDDAKDAIKGDLDDRQPLAIESEYHGRHRRNDEDGSDLLSGLKRFKDKQEKPELDANGYPVIDRSKGTVYKGRLVGEDGGDLKPEANKDPENLGELFDRLEEMIDYDEFAGLTAFANASRAIFTDKAARRARSTFTVRYTKSKVAKAHEQWVTDQEAVYGAMASQLRGYGVPAAEIRKFLNNKRRGESIAIVDEWTDKKIELAGGYKKVRNEDGEKVATDERNLRGKFMDKWASWGGPGATGFWQNMKLNFTNWDRIKGNLKKGAVVGVPVAVLTAVGMPFVGGAVGGGLALAAVAAGVRGVTSIGKGLFGARMSQSAEARRVAEAQRDVVRADVQSRIGSVASRHILGTSAELIGAHAGKSTVRNRLRLGVAAVAGVAGIAVGDIAHHFAGSIFSHNSAPHQVAEIRSVNQKPQVIEQPAQPPVEDTYHGARYVWTDAKNEYGAANATPELQKMIANLRAAGGHVETSGDSNGTHWIISKVTTPDGHVYTSSDGKWLALRAYEGDVPPADLQGDVWSKLSAAMARNKSRHDLVS
ncbi:MAG TPA: hypothetical protein VKQ34_04030 [Candidatus Saccharimonadales bacterium]|nr:hypothetical protein [Candidatus Saccharimonadales bacterium]